MWQNTSLSCLIHSMRTHAILFVVLVKTISTMFTSISPLCYPETPSFDCSSLMIGDNASFSGCYMYNKEECKSFAFETWTDSPLSIVTDEADSGFDVTAYAYKAQDGIAYNVTITNPSSDINGFVMNLTYEKSKYFSSCRIFDFRNLQGSFKYPFSLYYDCFIQVDRWAGDKYITELAVRSLPNNRQIVYHVNVPKIPSEAPGCNCETLVMYNVGALLQNKIRIKFHKFPRKLNILHYEVKLIALNSLRVTERKLLDANPTDGKEMISAVFENVEREVYNLSVEPLRQDGKRCSITYVKIAMHNKLFDYSFIGWVVGVIIFIVFVLVASFFAIKRKQKSILRKRQQRKLQMLLVSHPDNREFLDLMRCFGEYLETLIPSNILADWKLVNEDSASWIRTSFDSADIIVIVLSKGIITGNIDMSVPPPYGSLFWPVCRHVCKEALMNPKNTAKIYLKVYFENYDSGNRPQELKLAELGPDYKLMKDFKKVFCRMMGRNTYWSYFFHLPEPKALNAAIEKLKRKAEVCSI